MNAINDLTPQQLRQAADLQEQILVLRGELDQILGSTSAGPSGVPGRKHRLSAEGLANIRAGARKRWAKVHAENGAVGKPARRKGKMSAAGRAAISAKLKARWAAAKKAGKNAL